MGRYANTRCVAGDATRCVVVLYVTYEYLPVPLAKAKPTTDNKAADLHLLLIKEDGHGKLV